MGLILPNLGIYCRPVTAVRPIDAILTRTQQRVLGLLFVGETERTLNELVRQSGGGSGAIRREVERMAAAGFLRERRVGNQRRFSADRASPFYAALAALAVKSVEPAPGRSGKLTRPSAALIAGRGAVRKALARRGLRNPRVFGSVARGDDTETSDLDLLVDARPGTSLLDLVKAKHAVEDLLRVPVDLVTLDDLPESFRAAVVAESVPL
jgi:predicted nucleotidyltransferase